MLALISRLAVLLPLTFYKRGSILFVDDEPSLAEIGKQLLEKLGYQVVIRTNGMEALEAFRNQPDKFDLVITDMTMPKLNGAELSRHLMNIRPDIPIILCTGFSKLITEEQAKTIGIRAFAMKPMILSHIAKTMRKVLDDH